MTIKVKTFFDNNTATFTHVVTPMGSNRTAIIDSVMDYNPHSGKITTTFADKIIAYVREEQLVVDWILETHIHADHLSACNYLKTHLGGKTAISLKIKEVLALWLPIFNMEKNTPMDGSQFDFLLEDGDSLKLGETQINVLHTPGHTPACLSFLIENSIFVGDTIFMPDVGTARTDFPGGDAQTLYHSIQKILSLPQETQIFLCHDYPPNTRDACWITTVKQQRECNILIKDSIDKNQFVTLRQQRDTNNNVPKLLLPSLQFNLRAGSLGPPEKNNICYIKIPINQL